MKNREVYVKDPIEHRLLNDGVAEVTDARSDAELRTLRYELETFVCEGEYASGLRRILETYLRNLDQPVQPGVWVSGFFGSGKSHLLKVLRALWVDTEFPDGARARGIVELPTDIRDLLVELSTAGRRLGGLHAAAGKLGAGAGDSVRLELLALVFRSAGLPEQYPLARFVLWLRDEDRLEAVRSHVEAAGKNWQKELQHLWVSPHIAAALLEVDPSFAPGLGQARVLLREQFPPKVTDVSTEQMLRAIRDALEVDRRFPLTLIGLDEVQQYIGEDPNRTYRVQEVVETCSKHFEGRLLFVATGQTALSGTPMLQKLMGRFSVPIELSDTDVEAVVRKVILAKKPDKLPALERVVAEHIGEISRHLAGTQLAHRSEDRGALVADYPLLPVRRRFWGLILRAVDQGGTTSQLRNQLKVVHEAARATAEEELGNVVGGDFIYRELATNLLQTGVLPREVYEFIKELETGSEDEQLQARLYSLVFLIGKLPRHAAADPGTRANGKDAPEQTDHRDAGVRATADTLADLLVTDLRAGSAELRKRIPALLDALEESGKLMRVGEEYRVQTREGSAWNAEYRKQLSRIKNEPQRVAGERAGRLRSKCSEHLKKVKLFQGQSREQRSLALHFGSEEPPGAGAGGGIPIWVRDGWDDNEKSVLADARSADSTSPTLFVFLPKHRGDELRETLGSLLAAQATLDTLGQPSTPEGKEARQAMETRRERAEQRLKELLEESLAGARVFQGGGQEVPGDGLADKVARGAQSSLLRLYPHFEDADAPPKAWNKVIERARKGDTAALEAVNHAGDIARHPVPAAILKFVGSGKKGAEIRKHFGGSPYGWPRDTIDGALYALLASGDLRATDAWGKPVDAGGLDRKKLSQASFRVESVRVSTLQRIKLRKLLQETGITCRPGEELAGVARLLETLRELARSAGGEPPCPEPPSTRHLDELGLKAGNEQLVAVYERREELALQAREWKQRSERIAERLPRWRRLERLLAHAEGRLDEADELGAQVRAIREQRMLLHEPDPVPPLCERLTALLRDALNQSRAAYQEALARGMEQLEADENWRRLDPGRQRELLAAQGLASIPPIDTSDAERLLASLDDAPLSTWADRTDALAGRFDKLRRRAAELLEPRAVHVRVPSRTLKSPEEVRRWVREVERMLLEKLEENAGPVVVR